jgi:copper chaperone/Cu+-exporting ATPase
MAESTPIQFKVPDMDCNSCIASIEIAIHKIDPDAHIAADLATKRVIIGSAKAEAHNLIEAVKKAGFDVEAA